MPSRFLPSYTTIYFTAIFIGFLPSIFQRLPSGVHGRIQQHLPARFLVPRPPPVQCYTSIHTFDAHNSTHACLSVFPNGTFGPIFTPSPDNRSAYHFADGHVLPGLWDGHGHVLQHGEMLASVQLYGAASVAEVRRRIKTYLTSHPGVGTKRRWIKGIGWDQAHFNNTMPTAHDLAADPEPDGLYIMLDRVDVHCTWVSPAVLALLPAPLPDVPGGHVVRAPGPGVFCDNAMSLPQAHFPPPTRAQKEGWVGAAQRELHRAGVVGVHDAGVRRRDIDLYDALATDGRLRIRLYAMLECEQRNSFCPDEARRVHRRDGMLASRSVKLFADGALGSWGAALLAPYADRNSTGTMLVAPETLADVTRRWTAAGWGVNIHAIGDAANRAAVDAIERALSAACASHAPNRDAGAHSECMRAQQRQKRFRIEHAQVVHPADQARMHALGIIPSIQPTHATSDMAYALARLGPARLAHSAYRMRSLAPLQPVLGSDFPVEPVSPWEGIYAASTRRAPATGAGGEDGWYGAEKVGVWEAVRGFAVTHAYASWMEGMTGAIERGAWADWVVVKEDLMNGEGDSGRGVTVLETWVGGRRVYVRE